MSFSPIANPSSLYVTIERRKAATASAARAYKTKTSLFSLPMVIRSPSKLPMFLHTRRARAKDRTRTRQVFRYALLE